MFKAWSDFYFIYTNPSNFYDTAQTTTATGVYAIFSYRINNTNLTGSVTWDYLQVACLACSNYSIFFHQHVKAEIAALY